MKRKNNDTLHPLLIETRRFIYEKKYEYWLLLIISALLSGFGLVSGNTAVIIGSMLVAPYLSVLQYYVITLVIPDVTTFIIKIEEESREFKRIQQRLIMSTFMPIVAGIFIALAGKGSTWADFNNIELLKRASVSKIDFIIAFLVGLVGVLSFHYKYKSIELARKGKRERGDIVEEILISLVGVAVAISVIPPLTASGIFIGSGNLSRAIFAFLLGLINILVIFFVYLIGFGIIIVVFSAKKAPKPIKTENRVKAIKNARVIVNEFVNIVIVEPLEDIGQRVKNIGRYIRSFLTRG